ncbi:MAG TPA: tetratricopeptide repeat protein [Candidatus Acidoferrum sp.]|nr:tetratricopeptide repeat protein [Candidatus Acidoferrum sp.]
MLRGKTDEAYKQVSRALDAYPDYSIALATRGILNLNAGKTAEASVDFQNAIQADPDYGPPYVVLGALYNHAHRYNDALLVLTRARRLIPSVWQVHFEMGQALLGKGGDDTAALAEMTNAVRTISDAEAPEDRASVHFWRAHVLVQLKDFLDARSEYLRVIHEQPDGPWAGFARQALRLLPSRASLAVAEPVSPTDGNLLTDH